MSHLAPQAAIFSPSVARAAASTAKDWAYVDAWLKRQYTHLHKKQQSSSASSTTSRSSVPPSFERNAETLEVLLALVAANEAADEEQRRLAGVEESALREVRASEEEKENRRQQQQQEQQTQENETDPEPQNLDGAILAEDLLHAIDESLPKDAQASLDAMADVAVSLTSATDPDPSRLAHRFVALQGRTVEAEHLLRRLGMLRSYLDVQAERLALLLEELTVGKQYRLPDDIINISDGDKNRNKIKINSKNNGAATEEQQRQQLLYELERKVAALEKKVGGMPPLTVENVRADEEAYLDLLARKKDLDAQVKAFAGLPPDIEAARAELEGLRAQLREATERRDANFEMLVERESPVKVRNSRRP